MGSEIKQQFTVTYINNGAMVAKTFPTVYALIRHFMCVVDGSATKAAAEEVGVEEPGPEEGLILHAAALRILGDEMADAAEAAYDAGLKMGVSMAFGDVHHVVDALLKV